MTSADVTFPHSFFAGIRSNELRDRPVGRLIAGRPVVLFRDAVGRPHALYDRCSHRGVPLSRGRVVDGCVECPYHGWRFDGAGSCTRIPDLPPDVRIVPRTAVPAYTAEERHGYVWVGPGGDAPRWPIPALAEHGLSGWRAVAHTREVACDYRHMVENVLDGAHLPFVHAGSMERGRRSSLQWGWARRFRSGGQEVPPRFTIEDIEGGFVAHADGEGQPGGGEHRAFRFRVQLPSTVTVELDFGEKSVRVWVHVVPIRAGHCRVEHALLRNFALSPLADPLFLHSARVILREDADAVEALQPTYERDGDSWEVSVERDRLGLWYRKRLRGGQDAEEPGERQGEGASAPRGERNSL